MKLTLLTFVAAVALVVTVSICPVVDAQSPLLSVHVLDNENGQNGVNMTCVLYQLDEESNTFTTLNTQVTNSAGRLVSFMPTGVDYTAGTYRIWFDTNGYYTARSVPTFYPAAQVTYNCVTPSTDNHIVLSLSPFGFVTYRGNGAAV